MVFLFAAILCCRAAAVVCELQKDVMSALQCRLRECVGFGEEPSTHAAELCAAVMVDALKVAASADESAEQQLSLVICEVRSSWKHTC